MFVVAGMIFLGMLGCENKQDDSLTAIAFR